MSAEKEYEGPFSVGFDGFLNYEGNLPFKVKVNRFSPTPGNTSTSRRIPIDEVCINHDSLSAVLTYDKRSKDLRVRLGNNSPLSYSNIEEQDLVSYLNTFVNVLNDDVISPLEEVLEVFSNEFFNNSDDSSEEESIIEHNISSVASHILKYMSGDTAIIDAVSKMNLHPSVSFSFLSELLHVFRDIDKLKSTYKTTVSTITSSSSTILRFKPFVNINLERSNKNFTRSLKKIITQFEGCLDNLADKANLSKDSADELKGHMTDYFNKL